MYEKRKEVHRKMECTGSQRGCTGKGRRFTGRGRRCTGRGRCTGKGRRYTGRGRRCTGTGRKYSQGHNHQLKHGNIIHGEIDGHMPVLDQEHSKPLLLEERLLHCSPCEGIYPFDEVGQFVRVAQVPTELLKVFIRAQVECGKKIHPVPNLWVCVRGMVSIFGV